MTPDDGISQKILFVDDEVLLLNSIKRQFRRDFDITVAESGAAGLAAIAEQGPFAVVVSDYNMPGMDGVHFLNAVFQAKPETVLVMLTGRADLDLAIEALHNAHISRFLNKPCPKQIPRDTLADGLEQYRLRMSEQLALSADILDVLAGIVDVTSTALQSHWNREAFEQARDAIITALAKLSEYRDPETGAHLLRLKKYRGLICNELTNDPAYREKVTPAFTVDLIRSSPLHDIGKVGIPDAILKKPGKLTGEEFEIMKSHAGIGGDTLRAVYDQYPSQSFIKCGMDVAYCHHEKWNGSGYPQGLKGEAIPLAARILALVDVYDALTCRRVYKAPFPREKAKAIILEGSGEHFDPNIVKAFLSIEDDFFQIAEQYADMG